MIRKTLILFLVMSMANALPAAADSDNPISVRIVPTRFNENGERSIILTDPAQHFHVLLTNKSSAAIRLWRDWCSWGYFNLKFEIIGEDGKSTIVSKKNRAWNKNYPDWTSVPPGEEMILEVTLDESTWQGHPLPEPGKSRVVRLRAIFETTEDKESKSNNVWTGKVVSPENVYTLYR